MRATKNPPHVVNLQPIVSYESGKKRVKPDDSLPMRARILPNVRISPSFPTPNGRRTCLTHELHCFEFVAVCIEAAIKAGAFPLRISGDETRSV